MAIADKIREYLDKDELTYEFVEEDGYYRMFYSTKEAGTQVIAIDPDEERNVVKFVVPQLARIEDPDRLPVLAVALSAMNTGIVLGRFTIQPRSGSIYLDVTVPVDGGAFTYDQFRHCMVALLGVLDHFFKDIQRLIYSENITLEDLLRDDEEEEAAEESAEEAATLSAI